MVKHLVFVILNIFRHDISIDDRIQKLTESYLVGTV